MAELKSQLGDEEERAKSLAKLKNKYEAIIAELEEKLRKEQEVVDHVGFCFLPCDRMVL